MRADSLVFRLVVAAALWIAGALAAGGYLLSHIYTESVERGFDARLQVFVDGLIAVSKAGSGGGIELSRNLGEPRFTEPYSGWYWQVSGTSGPLLRSRSLWDMTLDLKQQGAVRAAAPSESEERASNAPERPGDESERTRGMESLLVDGPDGRQLRVVEREVTLPDVATPLRYAVAAETGEIVEEIARFDQALIYALAALGFGLIAAVVVQVYFGLLPLRRLRLALAAIRAGQTTQLEGSFPAEVKPLADELNALLAHNAAVVERARTHVGNLAHSLKTPLAVLANEAARAQGELARQVARQTAVMRRQVDHYLARARTAATGGVLGARTQVMPVAEDLKRTLDRIHFERRVRVTVAGEPEAYFRGEREDLEEMLGNVMDNGCKWAAVRVTVAIELKDGRLVVTVEDDGPGLSPEQRSQAFERGRRLDEATPGSGLGLAIVRDIAELYGGRVTLDGASLGGLKVVLDLPAAAAKAARKPQAAAGA
jgi:signal transduction histidine kinase